MELMPDGGIWNMVSQATWLVKTVLWLLAAMSFFSWVVIFYKIFSLGLAGRSLERDLGRFRRVDSLEGGISLLESGKLPRLTPVGRGAARRAREMKVGAGLDPMRRVAVRNILRRLLEQGVENQVRRMSSQLQFLATCANAAPFIGLFGTVWGIINAFTSIGITGEASLSTVAPGIAEALVATAVGLGVAIPATVAFNYFRGRVESLEARLEAFVRDFLNLAEGCMSADGNGRWEGEE